MESSVRPIVGLADGSDGRVLGELRCGQCVRNNRVVLEDFLNNVLENLSSLILVVIVVSIMRHGGQEGVGGEKSRDRGQGGRLVQLNHEEIVLLIVVVVIMMVVMRESWRGLQRLIVGCLKSVPLPLPSRSTCTNKEGESKLGIVIVLDHIRKLDRLDKLGKLSVLLELLPDSLAFISRSRVLVDNLLRFGERPIGHGGPDSIDESRLDR